MKKLSLILATLLMSTPAMAHDTHADATYMANEAVLIAQGDLKIMFDPFFTSGFGTYPEVPDEMMAKVVAQSAPFDGVDGIFVSHVHRDHFDGNKVFAYMQKNRDVNVFLPDQGMELLRQLAADDEQILNRLIPFALSEGGDPIKVIKNGLEVDAVRIPHSGWPRPERKDVNNIVFRVTLADGVTVMHMGDADINDDHYAPHEDHWRAKHTHQAFPPYWYFGNEEGRSILTKRLQVGHATGIHVPIKVPGGLEKYDYFSKPGESRVIYLPAPENGIGE